MQRLNNTDARDLMHLVSMRMLPWGVDGATFVSKTTGRPEAIYVNLGLSPVNRAQTLIHELCHAKFSAPAPEGLRNEVFQVTEDAWVHYHWWPEEHYKIMLNSMLEEMGQFCHECRSYWVNAAVGFRFAASIEAIAERGLDVSAARDWMEKAYTESERETMSAFIAAVRSGDKDSANRIVEGRYQEWAKKYGLA